MSLLNRADSQDAFTAQDEADYYGRLEMAELNAWHDARDAEFTNRLLDEAARK